MQSPKIIASIRVPALRARVGRRLQEGRAREERDFAKKRRVGV